MTGERLAKLMMDSYMKEEIAKIARRYTSDIQDQEEYIQDAWLRIAESGDDRTNDFYLQEALRAIRNHYQRKRYSLNVVKITPSNSNGISEGMYKKQVPKNARHLYGNKYLITTPQKLSSWYYEGEWDEYGIDKDSMRVFSFYEIVIVGDTG